MSIPVDVYFLVWIQYPSTWFDLFSMNVLLALREFRL